MVIFHSYVSSPEGTYIYIVVQRGTETLPAQETGGDVVKHDIEIIRIRNPQTVIYHNLSHLAGFDYCFG